MGLNYKNLDRKTRDLMLKEIERDVEAGTLFLSENLSQAGQSAYPTLLREAADAGTDVTLGVAIQPLLNSHEKPRRTKSGGLSKPPVMRRNAHEMLAEGEFNRFYIRAICLRAIEVGTSEVAVYRAKDVQIPRPESEDRIGRGVAAQDLLRDLRERPGVDTALGLPPGPNSGLSVHLT